MKTRRFIATALVAVALSIGPARAEFPERTIEVIYPWPPGATMSVTQIIAKAVGETTVLSEDRELFRHARAGADGAG